MGFFDDDFFGGSIEELFNKFANGGEFVEYSSTTPDGKRKVFRKNFQNMSSIPNKPIVTEKNIFLVFEFPGEKNLKVSIKDNLTKNNLGEKDFGKQKILIIKNSEGTLREYLLPSKVKTKNLNFSFHNGLLEVVFEK